MFVFELAHGVSVAQTIIAAATKHDVPSYLLQIVLQESQLRRRGQGESVNSALLA